MGSDLNNVMTTTVIHDTQLHNIPLIVIEYVIALCYIYYTISLFSSYVILHFHCTVHNVHIVENFVQCLVD